MKITRLASWVGPAYLGTTISSWAAASLYVWLARPEPLLGNLLLNWLVLVAFVTPIASALATTMLTLDVILLKLKVRALPTGGSAWRMALLAPLPVAGAFYLHHPSFTLGLTTLLLTVLAPVAASAFTVRLAMGSKIEHQAE
jgi:hypothetical protein